MMWNYDFNYEKKDKKELSVLQQIYSLFAGFWSIWK